MIIIQLKIVCYFIAYIVFIVFIIFIIFITFKSIFEFIINFNVLNKKIYEIIKFKIIDKAQIIALFIIITIFFFLISKLYIHLTHNLHLFDL